MAGMMGAEISKQGDVTVVTLGTEYENLNEDVLDGVQGVILDVTRTADPPLVVIDLSNTIFFGSAFLALLFRGWHRIGEREGGRFAISGLTPDCAEVLSVTHLDQLWDVYPSRDEAVNALAVG